MKPHTTNTTENFEYSAKLTDFVDNLSAMIFTSMVQKNLPFWELHLQN